MYKTIFLLLSALLLLSCTEQRKSDEKPLATNTPDKNILLLKAYNNNDFKKCLEILHLGADGRIDYLKPGCPLLFDIYQRMIYPEVEELFYFYVKYRKEAFEDSISGVYPTQTVGSYLSRFASIELLRRLVKEKINIFSPEENRISEELLSDKEMLSYFGTDERNMHGAIYELSWMSNDNPFYSRIYRNRKLVINAEEKKERMELLLDAGADVTAVSSISKATIFHYFCWYPFEEDYTGLLDRMREKGADLFQKDRNGYSCINYKANIYYVLKENAEVYLEYVISRGLDVTLDDLYDFLSKWSTYIASAEITDIEKKRLEKIKKILEKNLNVTAVINSKGGWRVIE